MARWIVMFTGALLALQLPGQAQPDARPGGLPDSTAAFNSKPVTTYRPLQLHLALGIQPTEQSIVPAYYSALGISFELPLLAPLGLRGGAEWYPGAFNLWSMPFGGYAANLDLTLAAAKTNNDGPLPFIALGNRLMQIIPASDPRNPTAPLKAPYSAFSVSLIIGVRLPNGLALETRYPFYRGDNDTPAFFETALGYWRNF
ncbi:MAG: hypothetical protein HY692_06025 [Cyanobacteria bacterium NC_groundwater_1444_Ag_S-0.65um_54_12]|nr:hypothetical protein [Cyanobacteria bacterium NC_groundwater_1444_Ag_S-0.65um_54_12]